MRVCRMLRKDGLRCGGRVLKRDYLCRVHAFSPAAMLWTLAFDLFALTNPRTPEEVEMADWLLDGMASGQERLL